MILTGLCVIDHAAHGVTKDERWDEEHIMRRSRTILATGLAAAMALTAVDLRPVAAAAKAPDLQASQAVGALDVSAQRRHYRQSRQHRYYGHRGNAAGAAAVLGVFGAIAGVAAANSYRNRHYYDYGPSEYYSGGYGYAPYRGHYGGYRGHYVVPGGPGYNYGPTPHGFIGSPGY